MSVTTDELKKLITYVGKLRDRAVIAEDVGALKRLYSDLPGYWRRCTTVEQKQQTAVDMLIVAAGRGMTRSLDDIPTTFLYKPTPNDLRGARQKVAGVLDELSEALHRVFEQWLRSQATDALQSLRALGVTDLPEAGLVSKEAREREDQAARETATTNDQLAQARVAELTKQRDVARTDLETRREEDGKLRAARHFAEEQAKKAEAKAARAEEQLSSRNSAPDTTAELAARERELAEQRSRMESLSKQVESWRSQYNAAQTHLVELTGEKGALLGEKIALQRRVDEAEKRAQEPGNQPAALSATDGNSVTLASELVTAHNELRALQRNEAGTMERAERAEREKMEAEQRLKEQATALADAEGCARDLTAKVDEARQEAEEAKGDAAAAQELAEKLEGELRELRKLTEEIALRKALDEARLTLAPQNPELAQFILGLLDAHTMVKGERDALVAALRGDDATIEKFVFRLPDTDWLRGDGGWCQQEMIPQIVAFQLLVAGQLWEKGIRLLAPRRRDQYDERLHECKEDRFLVADNTLESKANRIHSVRQVGYKDTKDDVVLRPALVRKYVDV